MINNAFVPAKGDLCVTAAQGGRWALDGVRLGSAAIVFERLDVLFAVLLARAWKISVSGPKRYGLAQIEGDAEQIELGGIGFETHVARAGPAITSLPGSERA